MSKLNFKGGLTYYEPTKDGYKLWYQTPLPHGGFMVYNNKINDKNFSRWKSYLYPPEKILVHGGLTSW